MHELYYPRNIDITQQFVCGSMRVTHSCNLIKRKGPPDRLIDSQEKEKFHIEEDLIVFEAQRRGIYRYEGVTT